MKKGRGLLPFLLILFLVGCGKKGPPLPPLVRLPAPPEDFSAVRRGSTVAIQFVVPEANTDGSTPADVSRVDVYALTGGSTLTADEIVRRGARVGTVVVNPPPDPDAPEGETPSPASPASRDALDQGATARLSEPFKPDPNSNPSDVRSYVAVGINKRGRRGGFSDRAPVPIAGAPDAPSQPEVTWDETSLTITWQPSSTVAVDSGESYHVYAPGDVETRLTDKPLAETRFVDRPIAWDAERCYLIRAMATAGGLSLESEGSRQTCVTPIDTFPPAAPGGLNTVAADGAVNLIWDPSGETDLAGYLVLRAIAPDQNLVSLTPSPVLETTFRDTVPAGTRVTYAVQAVDKAGNISPMSARVEETAR